MSRPVTLAEAFALAGIEPLRMRGGDAVLTGATLDSRRVSRGDLFVAMPGMTNDPHRFVADALTSGAAAALVHDPAFFDSDARPMAVLPTEAFAAAVGPLTNAIYDHPTRSMRVVGVTGTNGKTTVASLVRGLFSRVEGRSGYLGTLGFSLDGLPDEELSNTTPFAVETFALLARARDAGMRTVAMEVSSHALAQGRVNGVEFDAGVWTNLTQDHLDFHGTMDAYREAKARLFRERATGSTKPFVAVINADDPAIPRGLAPHEFRASRRDASSDLLLSKARIGVARIEGILRMRSGEKAGFAAPLGGEYNAENILLAAGTLVALGYPLAQVAEALGDMRPVPGRFEPVPNDRGIGIIVDYAHTPDALEKVLDAVRGVTSGKVIAVFGCGGDRDRSKRPKMARAASERADLSVVTSDNPRTEDPVAILDEVLTGIAPGRAATAILDRGEAIGHAIAQARPGDTVVIAGKGHENYQIIGREKLPMDDRALARAGLEALPAKV